MSHLYIHGPDEIDKIEKGDVMVTEMTNPAYVPAMKGRNIQMLWEASGTS